MLKYFLKLPFLGLFLILGEMELMTENYHSNTKNVYLCANLKTNEPRTKTLDL
jgi:hypothetical protein